MFSDWIRQARENGASDLHLEAGTPLVFRVRGELTSVGAPIPGDALLQAARELLNSTQWQEFLHRRSYDFSRTVVGMRCRVNVYQTARGVGMAVRLLTSFQNNLRDCNLHPDLARFAEARHGLVIVSGPTGSGKSTTLAALIEEINSHQRRHIVMVESPIEYFFVNRRSFIRQREVPTHTPSFEQAIIDSMRENPDVLVIGEMRTADVMRLTLNAAETGHLVLATLHSSTSAEALARICLSFPAELQSSIRSQLADCLVGVVCQRLEYLPQHGLRVPLCEILVGNTSARSNVRGGQFSQILSSIQTGGEEGMWSFDRYRRWVDQKRDWVRPQQARPLDSAARAEVSDGLSAEASPRPASSSSVRTPARPGAIPIPTPAARPAIPAHHGSVPPSEPTVPGRLEIPIAEEDLEELAKKISETDEG